MFRILTVLIVATAALLPTGGAGAEEGHSDAVQVFSCDFEQEWNRDFDDWPDRWQRATGTLFPHYVQIGLDKEHASQGQRSLQIRLNGGAAAVFSPRIPVRSLFSYVMEAMVQAERLERDEFHISVTLYDRNHVELEIYRSEQFRNVGTWHKVRIGPITSSHETASYAVIGLHLEPTLRPDLHGHVRLDDVWFARLPRMILSTGSAHNVYTDFDDVQITCEVSGIPQQNPVISFEVVDVFGKTVASSENRIEGSIVEEIKQKARSRGGDELVRQEGYAGSTAWKPPLTEYGYYEIHVSMKVDQGKTHERTLALAVVRPQYVPEYGEFGWTLPQGDRHLTLTELEELVSLAGINWIKFPVWYAGDAKERADQLVRFAERLSFHHVEMVGLLHDPPKDLQNQLGEGELAADIFSGDPQLWQPTLEHVMTRLSLKIVWWQLGSDQDTSFVNYPELAEKIRTLRSQLYRFGQEVNLGFGWRWLNELPHSDAAPPWQFLSMSAEPGLAAHEMSAYLKESKQAKVRRWVAIEPVSRAAYGPEVRAKDLIRRMLAAKISGADAVFVPDPFHSETGMMNDDGTPNDLFLPWRSTALALAAGEHLGSMRLPGGSSNHVFAQNGKAVVVIWNEKPTTETIFLDDDVQIADVWGRAVPFRKKEAEHGTPLLIPVGPMPVFITGANAALVRTQMSFQFTEARLPSVFGQSHAVAFRIQNHFPSGVSGQVTLVSPWRMQPQRMNLQMSEGQQAAVPFEIDLPFNASSGRQDIRIDFDIKADHDYRFSVYRHIDVGLGDVEAKIATRLNERGELEVEQQLFNNTDESLNFKCLLFAPNRRRLRTQVLELGRGMDVRTYRLHNGSELVGKQIKIRIEEVDGARTLNYLVRVEE